MCLQVHEALEIVKVYPSPLTCAVAYQICMLGGDEASAGNTDTTTAAATSSKSILDIMLCLLLYTDLMLQYTDV
jgi:hypothetical protein